MYRIALVAALLALTSGNVVPENVAPAAEPSDEVPLWGQFQTQLRHENSYANPFQDVTLQATFTAPSGRLVKFLGYYDGDGQGGQTGHVWRLRFMPDEVGRWSFASAFSDGSAGIGGGFSCVSQGAKPGPLRAEGWRLRLADGKPFCPRSYYFSEVFCGASPHWQTGIDQFFGKTYGYNLCVSTFWQGSLLQQNRWNNLPYDGFYPLHDNDYTRLNIAAWKHVDEVLQRLEAAGVVWFNFDGFLPNVGGTMGTRRTDFAAQQVYVRNVVARLAPYWNIVWNVAFEWSEFLQADQVALISDYTKELDPWKHLITVHDQGPYRTGKEIVSNLHVDFVTLQYDAGRARDAVAANRLVQQYAGSWPVFGQEMTWEAPSKLNADEIRRVAWGIHLGGGFTCYAEMFDGPHEGQPENYGDGKALPYLEILFDYLQSLPQAGMEPHNELVVGDGICLAKPGTRYVCYSPAGSVIQLRPEDMSNDFSAQWLNPRTGMKSQTEAVRREGTLTFSAPDENDWVLDVQEEPSSASQNLRLRSYVFDLPE